MTEKKGKLTGSRKWIKREPLIRHLIYRLDEKYFVWLCTSDPISEKISRQKYMRAPLTVLVAIYRSFATFLSADISFSF